MSDILESLLDNYLADLATQKVSGDLTWVRHYAVVDQTIATRWYGLLPLVLLYPEVTTLQPDSLEGSFRSDFKRYRIRMTCLITAYDQSYGIISSAVPDYRKAIEYGADLETRYNRRTFDVSAACTLLSVSYGTPAIAGFLVSNQGWAHGVDLVFEHLYEDRRLL